MIRSSNYENTLIKNYNPKNLPLREPIDTLINSICLSMNITWVESFKLLYAQAHKFCNIPTKPQCLNGMLYDLGFNKIRLSPEEQHSSAYDMLADLDKRLGDEDTAILKLRWSKKRTDIYATVCFRTFCGEYYHMLAAGADEHLSETYVK